MKNKLREKTIEKLKDLPVEDIVFILNRYCTPHTTILCAKQFGFELDRKAVEELIAYKSFEEIVLK